MQIAFSGDGANGVVVLVGDNSRSMVAENQICCSLCLQMILLYGRATVSGVPQVITRTSTSGRSSSLATSQVNERVDALADSFRLPSALTVLRVL